MRPLCSRLYSDLWDFNEPKALPNMKTKGEFRDQFDSLKSPANDLRILQSRSGGPSCQLEWFPAVIIQPFHISLHLFCISHCLLHVWVQQKKLSVSSLGFSHLLACKYIREGKQLLSHFDLSVMSLLGPVWRGSSDTVHATPQTWLPFEACQYWKKYPQENFSYMQQYCDSNTCRWKARHGKRVTGSQEKMPLWNIELLFWR